MLHAIEAVLGMETMPVGQSGRLVIEIDPELKKELYAALEEDGVNLKQWFLARVQERLQDRKQLTLPLAVSDGDPQDRKYR
jgi:hypothetical protein